MDSTSFTASRTTLFGHSVIQVKMANETAVSLQSTGPMPALYVVLDRSGSMAGSPINAAKAALCSTLPALAPSFSAVSLILFESGADEVPCTGKSKEAIHKLISRVVASGGTSFLSWKEALLKSAARLPRGTPVRVVLLSDGEDYNIRDPAGRNAFCERLREGLISVTGGSELHTIGLGSQHDAALLSALTASGSHAGTFVFASSAAHVEETIRSNLSIASRKVIPSSLRLRDRAGNQLGAEKTGYFTPVTGGSDADGNQYQMSVIVANDVQEPDSALVNFSGKCTSLRLSGKVDLLTKLKLSKDSPTFAAQVESCCSQVSDIIGSVTASFTSTAQSMHGDMEALKKKSSELSALSKGVFDELMPLVGRNKPAKTELYTALTTLRTVHEGILLPMLRNQPIANKNFAEVAHVAHSNVRGKLGGVLNKRAMGNRERLDADEIAIQRAVDAIDFNDDSKFSGTDEYGECVYRLMGVRDLLAEKECLFLALQVARPEAAIVNPSRLIIRAVTPSVISSGALLDALMYRLTEADPSEVHGGFDASASGSVVTGRAREDINGGMPLFVNREHWSVAKLCSRPAVGWMFTLDVLGFSQAQMTVLPFLVLAWIESNATDSSFWERVRGWVLDVCTAVYHDYRSIRESLFIQADGGMTIRYVTDIENRLPENTACHDTLLTQLKVGMQIENISPSSEGLERLLFALVIEEWRRKYSRSRSTYGTAYSVSEIVGLDTEKHINPAAEKLSAWLSEEQTGNEEQIPEDFHKSLGELQWRKELISNEKVKECAKSIGKIASRFSSKLAIERQIRVTEVLVIMLLVVKYPKSSDVRERATHFSKDIDTMLRRPKEYLSTVLNEVLRKEIMSGYSVMLRNVQIRNMLEVGARFAEVDDLKDAMELVAGKLKIGFSLPILLCGMTGLPYKGERRTGLAVVPQKALEKLQFLTVGKIGEEELYLDKDSVKRRTANMGLAWKAGRLWVRRVFKTAVLDTLLKDDEWNGVVQESVLEKWCNAFPWLERELQMWGKEVTETSNEV